MEEYLKEAEEVSSGRTIVEAYDKEWALKDQGFREGMEEGVAQGFERGIEQGILENQKEMVQNMLSRGLTIEYISDITGLTKEEIELIVEAK